MSHLDYWRVVLSCAGVIAAFYAASIYIRQILKGKIKPNRVTWGGWSLVGLLGIISSVRGGAGVGLLVTAAFELTVVIVFALSLMPKYGKPGGDKLDYVAGAIASVALLSQLLVDYSPNVGQVIAISADLVFLWPTVRGAWLKPDEERIKPWAVGAIGEIFGIAALGNWSFGAAGYSYYILFGNLAVIFAVWKGHHRLAQRTNKKRSGRAAPPVS